MAPETGPGSAQPRHSLECLYEDESGVPCGAAFGGTTDFVEAQDWAIRHAGRNPRHRLFNQTITDRQWSLQPDVDPCADPVG
jgi:hypothetical protein